MKKLPIVIAALLTAALCGCVSVPLPKDKAKVALEQECVSEIPGAHCISGERLRSYGYGNTGDALRYALFPWVSFE